MITGSHPLSAALASGLSDRGDQVVLLAPERPAGALPAETVLCDFRTEAEVAEAVTTAVGRLGGLDQVVHAWVAPGVLRERQFMDVTSDEWAKSCEASLEGAWWLMRHLSAPLRESGGGSVVVVIPSIALTGGANYSMLATVAEGVRVLAKGCGRQWPKYGINVNTVATAPHHWVSDRAGEALSKAFSLSVPAFGGAGAHCRRSRSIGGVARRHRRALPHRRARSLPTADFGWDCDMSATTELAQGARRARHRRRRRGRRGHRVFVRDARRRGRHRRAAHRNRRPRCRGDRASGVGARSRFAATYAVRADVDAAVEAAVSHFGGLDTMVHNALGPVGEPTADRGRRR